MKIDEAYHTLMKRYLWLVLVCIQPIFPQPLFAEEVLPKKTEVQWDAVSQTVEQIIGQQEVAGVQVLIQHQGQLVYNQAFGYRDIASKAPLQTDSVYRFYSMTKPITSVAVMMLVEEGKIDLHAPVAKYLPELKGLTIHKAKRKGEQTITVHQLLTHTAGMTYGFFGNTSVDKMYQRVQPLYSTSNDEMLTKLAPLPLLYPPGTRWHYSISIDVLGVLVERVSGQSLGDFFQERIFTPLEMKDTTFQLRSNQIDRFTTVYTKRLKVVDAYNQSYFASPNRMESGGGGLLSTGADYVNFCEMLINLGEWDGTRLLKPETVVQMTQNQLPKDVLAYGWFGFGYGFKVQIQDWGDKGHIGEYGWAGAASTHFWISPNDDLIVIALSQEEPFNERLVKALKPVVYETLRSQ